MDMHRLCNLMHASDAFADELLAANALNDAFKAEVASMVSDIQSRTFLSNSLKRGYQNRTVFRFMLNKEAFYAFWETEYEIKLIYSKEAKKAFEQESIEFILNYKGE